MLTLLPFLLLTPLSTALHDLNDDPMYVVHARDSELPFTVTNLCREDIYPAILTQSGIGPASGGFLLAGGDTKSQTVSADWRGRVWGRTNCTFNAPGTNPASSQGGQVCSTGDCGPFIECKGAGQPPATLAEFTMSSGTGQTFYDLSLVDGYNIPMGIIYLGTAPNASEADPVIPPNLTNPMCIATAAQMAPMNSNSTEIFATNISYPIPLEERATSDFVQGWCPWDLQQSPPQKPGDGVYPYPDDNIQRPLFNPCLSACAKWNKPEDCCTGSHDTPNSCGPGLYSTQAKQICPDAYSYAFDDQTSTFIIPEGGGFEIVFCPPGRSSNILAVFGDQLRQLAATGMVTRSIAEIAQNVTYIREKNEAPRGKTSPALMALVVWMAYVCFSGSWV